MPHYIVSIDEKGPILWGPYDDQVEMLKKQGSMEGQPQVYDLPTRNRQRAARMIKEKMSTGGSIPRFGYGKS